MMRSLVVLTLTLILALATTAQAEVFRWTTAEGVVSFTDSEKMIPARYKDSAEKVILDPLKNFDRLTISTVNNEEVVPSPAQVTFYNPNRVDECTGLVTVTTERRQFGEFHTYNRRIYVTRDECGNTISETFYSPEVRVNR